MGAALNVGVTPIEIKEIVYQAVPYLGLARAFDFATRVHLEERQNGHSRNSVRRT
jgi:4-carboxymuconolactone decarboxylase